MVTLNYRSFSPSLHYRAAARDACSRSCLNVIWASKRRSTRSPTYCQFGEGVLACMITWDCWKFGRLHEFACHSCARTMLFLSASLEFSCMSCPCKQDHTTLHLDRSILLTSKGAFACGGTEILVMCSFSPLPHCSMRCLEHVLAWCNLSHQAEIYSKPYLLAICWGSFCTHGHLRFLKIWNASGISVSSLGRAHANLLCIVPDWIYLLWEETRSHSTTLDREILVTRKASFACCGNELPIICSFSPVPECSRRRLQQVLAGCNLSQQTEIYAKPYFLVVWGDCVRTHVHLRCLKIWNASRICVSSLCKCMVIFSLYF